MVLRLTAGEETLVEEEYYSVGGGFIIRKGEPDAGTSEGTIPYPYGSMAELKAPLATHGLTLDKLLMTNGIAVTGRSRTEINKRLDNILDFMHRAVRRGLRHKGMLPGSIKLKRKAPVLYQQARGMSHPGRFFAPTIS